jgi:hypothetical protein
LSIQYLSLEWEAVFGNPPFILQGPTSATA